MGPHSRVWVQFKKGDRVIALTFGYHWDYDEYGDIPLLPPSSHASPAAHPDASHIRHECLCPHALKNSPGQDA